MLTKLLALNANLKPETIMLDFEKAMHNAMKLVFPSTEIKGCFFSSLPKYLQKDTGKWQFKIIC